MSLLDKILEKDDVKRVLMEVPEWEVTIGVRSVTVAEVRETRADATNRVTKEPDPLLLSVLLVITATYDPETNKPLFNRVHRDALMAKHPAVIDRIADRVVSLSNLTPDSTAVSEKN